MGRAGGVGEAVADGRSDRAAARDVIGIGARGVGRIIPMHDTLVRWIGSATSV